MTAAAVPTTTFTMLADSDDGLILCALQLNAQTYHDCHALKANAVMTSLCV